MIFIIALVFTFIIIINNVYFGKIITYRCIYIQIKKNKKYIKPAEFY